MRRAVVPGSDGAAALIAQPDRGISRAAVTDNEPAALNLAGEDRFSLLQLAVRARSAAVTPTQSKRAARCLQRPQHLKPRPSGPVTPMIRRVQPRRNSRNRRL